MPTYEYICRACETKVEAVQSFTDDNLETCAECGGKLRKIIFPVGIQFKGSGFYSTDRKASQPISRVKDKDKSTDKGESTDKGDSKPESKKDSKDSSGSETRSEPRLSESKSEGSDKSKKKKVSEKSS